MLGVKGLWDTENTHLVEVTGSAGLKFREEKSQTTHTNFTNYVQRALGREDHPGSSSDEHPWSRLDEAFSKFIKIQPFVSHKTEGAESSPWDLVRRDQGLGQNSEECQRLKGGQEKKAT